MPSPTELTPGTILTVTVDSLAHGGAAVCRTAAGVVFVPGLLPGEHARICITEVRRNFAHAHLQQVLRSAPERLPAACPAAAHGAGCCNLSFTSAAHAASLKRAIAQDQLHRLAALHPSLVDAMHSESLSTPTPAGAVTPQPMSATQAPMRHWRTVSRWRVAANGTLGALAAGTHEVITAARCTQPVPELLAAADSIEATGVLPPGSDLALRAAPDGTVCGQWRAAPQSTAPQSTATATPSRAHARRSRAQRIRAERARHRNWQPLPADLGIAPVGPAATHEDPTRVWQLPASAFWQPHRGAIACYHQHIRAAIAEVCAAAGVPGAGVHVWDLYAGVGALSAGPVAVLTEQADGVTVHAVETSADAVQAADRQAWGEHAAVSIHRGAVDRWLGSPTAASSRRAAGAALLAITDPPRAGLGDDVIKKMADLQVPQLVHIGCDLAAFARDVGMLSRVGFEVCALSCVDAFPGTSHAEAVALLRWRG